MTLNQIVEKLKTEHARSQLKHGKWVGLSCRNQYSIIQSGVDKWTLAWMERDAQREVAELVQVMNRAARRIMYLTGEDQ